MTGGAEREAAETGGAKAGGTRSGAGEQKAGSVQKRAPRRAATETGCSKDALRTTLLRRSKQSPQSVSSRTAADGGTDRP